MLIASSMVVLYTAYMWALIAAATLVFGGLLVVLSPVARKGPIYRLISRAWGRIIVRASGVRFSMIGADKLDPLKPCVYMSNHQSYFDVICEIGYLPHPARFVAKKELVYIPIFGQAMWASGHIIINRSRHADSMAGLKKAADKIRAGTSILVFPEGTRSPDHKLGEFKKGGFMLALEAQVPIVPVSVSGTHPMMPKDGFTFRKSDVTIVIGEPIPTAGLTAADRTRLIDLTRAAIIKNFPAGSAEALANQKDPVLEKISCDQ
ncbi:MAG TPA: lysophospholipid acyltransferase family protein [bacterium]|nr:lysophospholipid acyltransferase family protein [bacterium]